MRLPHCSSPFTRYINLIDEKDPSAELGRVEGGVYGECTGTGAKYLHRNSGSKHPNTGDESPPSPLGEEEEEAQDGVHSPGGGDQERRSTGTPQWAGSPTAGDAVPVEGSGGETTQGRWVLDAGSRNSRTDPPSPGGVGRTYSDSSCQCTQEASTPHACTLSSSSVVFILNSLACEIVFEPGYSTVLGSSSEVLDKVAELVTALGQPVAIEGRVNTVNKKGSPVKIDSKKIIVLEENCTWQELALLRAEKVAECLVARGVGRAMLTPAVANSVDPLTLEPANAHVNR